MESAQDRSVGATGCIARGVRLLKPSGVKMNQSQASKSIHTDEGLILCFFFSFLFSFTININYVPFFSFGEEMLYFCDILNWLPVSCFLDFGRLIGKALPQSQKRLDSLFQAVQELIKIGGL